MKTSKQNFILYYISPVTNKNSFSALNSTYEYILSALNLFEKF